MERFLRLKTPTKNAHLIQYCVLSFSYFRKNYILKWRLLAEARISIISHIVTKVVGRVKSVLPGHHHLTVVGARRQAQHALKSPLEVGVAQWIEDGIERRVDVAQPNGGRVELRVDAVLAERHHHEKDKVRQPTQHKRAHYHTQLSRCLFLLLKHYSVRCAATASVCAE
jgi:hypothetical protein